MPDVALELAAVNELASLTGWNITNVRLGPDERGLDVLFEVEGRRAGAQHTTFHWDDGDIPGMRLTSTGGRGKSLPQHDALPDVGETRLPPRAPTLR